MLLVKDIDAIWDMLHDLENEHAVQFILNFVKFVNAYELVICKNTYRRIEFISFMQLRDACLKDENMNPCRYFENVARRMCYEANTADKRRVYCNL